MFENACRVKARLCEGEKTEEMRCEMLRLESTGLRVSRRDREGKNVQVIQNISQFLLRIRSIIINITASWPKMLTNMSLCKNVFKCVEITSNV